MPESPRELRARHRAERREVLTTRAEERRDPAREPLAEQRAERRARGRGRSRRAPAMNVDDRRAAILEVAVPMLIEHGANVKTSEIAAAAGIAEGTLFRAFQDKRALFVACLKAVLESEAEVAQIRRIDRSLPIADRLTEAVRAVSDYQTRLWQLLVALRTAGVDPRDDWSGAGDHEHGPPQAMIRISAAVAELFDADRLRVAPDLAARLLLGSVFSNRMQVEGLGHTGAELPELVDLLLHGILRDQPHGGQ